MEYDSQLQVIVQAMQGGYVPFNYDGKFTLAPTQ